MISQYSNPVDIDREFWEDYERVRYWFNKKTQGRVAVNKILDDVFDVVYKNKKSVKSDIIYYTSPKTGNRWMGWVTSTLDSEGKPHAYCRYVLYYYTEQYMTIMAATTLIGVNKEGETGHNSAGISIYTAHMFQRMADPDRLGVDMTDRVKVIRNFLEFIAAGWSDTRPPKKGEKHTQIMLRTPASWIRGHIVMVGDRHVAIYRTFWTDKSMTPQQKSYVRSFSKFADMKIKEGKSY